MTILASVIALEAHLFNICCKNTWDDLRTTFLRVIALEALLFNICCRESRKETKNTWDDLRTTFSPRPCPRGPNFSRKTFLYDIIHT
jgi:hypothetical protein